MIVLGITQKHTHDPSSALLVDGKIAACIEQERLSRVKHAPGERADEAAQSCLKIAGITMKDVDAVAVPYSFNNIRKLRFVSFKRSLGRRGRKAWRILLKGRGKERAIVKDARQTIANLGGDPKKIPVVTIEHHFAHAASAFFFSSMEDAAILTVDGEGELTSTLFGEADRISEESGHDSNH